MSGPVGRALIPPRCAAVHTVGVQASSLPDPRDHLYLNEKRETLSWLTLGDSETRPTVLTAFLAERKQFVAYCKSETNSLWNI